MGWNRLWSPIYRDLVRTIEGRGQSQEVTKLRNAGNSRSARDKKKKEEDKSL